MNTTRTIRGGTSIYGALRSLIDGQACLDLPADGKMRFAVPDAMLGAVAARVGSVVGLEGMATWDVDTLAIVGFEPTRLTAYDPGSTTLAETFDALREASGGRWDGVDVEAYMREIRGD